MSDPKREKLEAEAREWLRGGLKWNAKPEEEVRDLADWAERREREAVADALKPWREAESLPDCPACAVLEAGKTK